MGSIRVPRLSFAIALGFGMDFQNAVGGALDRARLDGLPEQLI